MRSDEWDRVERQLVEAYALRPLLFHDVPQLVDLLRSVRLDEELGPKLTPGVSLASVTLRLAPGHGRLVATVNHDGLRFVIWKLAEDEEKESYDSKEDILEVLRERVRRRQA